ncbi:DUF4112 domain-containing protein [Pontibacter harenae]|uniref:DUF4112 domain-containing protein n=1 Tax=Pontibacter harenae TaxID=2894083 RepID=UPI001E4FC4D7|nr:DUF4112 domain-containing protein [Pontibacter harenae]MCC9167808.1 DUF4112 domain-containing protein [Pontibacter harenae]
MANSSGRYTRTPRSENLKWVEYMVSIMDNQFRFPGTKWRFGLDPILGLLPVVGDLASFSMSAVIVLTMAKHGASGKLVALMLVNIALDALIGSIPLLGNIFDFAFKANERNVRMLRAYYEEGKYQGSGKNVVLGVLVGIIVLFVLLVWVLWELGEWIYNLLLGLF